MADASSATAAASYRTVLFDVAEGVARLTLNRPERLNALDLVMNSEIADVLDRVEGDPAIRVLVITGAGRAFSAGANLADEAMSGGARPDLGKVIEEQYNPIIEKLHASRVPVVAAVNGVIAGAAVNIALACDIVIAMRSASFLQAFVKIGLLPDAGGTYALPHLLGTARALGLALLAEPLSAEKAAEWGMIWRCVDDAEFVQSVGEVAQRLAASAPLALARIKQAIRAATRNSLNQQLVLERDLQRELGYTEDFMEGVTAFFGKRAPGFKGH